MKNESNLVQPESKIQTLLNQLAAELVTLDKVLSELGARISPVVVESESGTNATMEGCAAPIYSPIAGLIANDVDYVKRLTNQVQRYIDSLEV